jgi:hypothetical protein
VTACADFGGEDSTEVEIRKFDGLRWEESLPALGNADQSRGNE